MPCARLNGHRKLMARSQRLLSEPGKGSNNRGRKVDGRLVQNSILQTISESEFLALKPHLKFEEFEVSDYLLRQGNLITHAFFLNKGVAAMVIETSDARTVEVGAAGCECMIGLPAAGGQYQTTYSVIVQAPSNGFGVPVKVINRILPSTPDLHRMLIRRLAIRSVAEAQISACNRLHSLMQRLARWLLLMHDRMPSERIGTTHDIMSKMMGTDRATISLAIADFESRGLLRRHRGSLTITNRPKLQEHSCECYSVLRQFHSELGLKRSAG
jgi:CRP-like cAMP-binding protein